MASAGEANLFSASSLLTPNRSFGDQGGRSKLCCVPMCKGSFYDRNGKATGLSFFKFPTERGRKLQWLAIIKREERKGIFEVTDSTKMCEQHFTATDIKVHLNAKRKSLRPGVTPSIFPWTEEKENTTKSPTLRPLSSSTPNKSVNLNHPTTSTTGTNESNTTTPMDIDMASVSKASNSCQVQECKLLQKKLGELKKENLALKSENLRMESELRCLRQKQFTYGNIREDPEAFVTYTGISVEKFEIIYDHLNPGRNSENMKFYDTSKKKAEEDSGEKSGTSFTESSKPGPKPKLSSVIQLFMFLVWLRQGFSQSHLSWLFDIPKTTVSRYLITWANYLYFCLGSIPIWPSKEQVIATMPECFRDTYPTTRCIIDCTELFVQVPSSLAAQSALYSYYKHHVTYKGLVGIAPSGAITFVSQLYPGSISDKEIVQRCGILHPLLWDDGDSVMADRGFTIEDDLRPLKVKLNIPAFLEGKDQLDQQEVIESQAIASVRIYVERVMSRIKKFKVLKAGLSLALHGSVNQVWTVACLLCNFMDPLIKQQQRTTSA